MNSNRFFKVLAAMYFAEQHYAMMGKLPTATDMSRYLNMTPQGARLLLKHAVKDGLMIGHVVGKTWHDHDIMGYKPNMARYKILRLMAQSRARVIMQERYSEE